MRAFKKKYLNELKAHGRSGEFEMFDYLPAAKRGRRVLLGEDLDKALQYYVKALHSAGGSIGSSIVIAAHIICTREIHLAENGGTVVLTKDWALSLLRWLGFVKRKATTKANMKMSEHDFQGLKKSFLDQIVAVVSLHSVPHNLIINLDQTGMKLVPSGDWTMASVGSKRVEIAGLEDKRQITATFAGTLSGSFLRTNANPVSGKD